MKSLITRILQSLILVPTLSWANAETSTKKSSLGALSGLGFGVMSSPGNTSNSSMPSLVGLRFEKTISEVPLFFELARGTYENDSFFSTTVVASEKVDQKSKLVVALGTGITFWNYFVFDGAIGINQFSYSNSGTDLSCCVNKAYERSYDFSGLFVRPSLGAELKSMNWTLGVRLFSWMQYLSKSVSNAVDDRADNAFITTTLDSIDKDTIQSSHGLPPHIYITYTF